MDALGRACKRADGPGSQPLSDRTPQGAPRCVRPSPWHPQCAALPVCGRCAVRAWSRGGEPRRRSGGGTMRCLRPELPELGRACEQEADALTQTHRKRRRRPEVYSLAESMSGIGGGAQAGASFPESAWRALAGPTSRRADTHRTWDRLRYPKPSSAWGCCSHGLAGRFSKSLGPIPVLKYS